MTVIWKLLVRLVHGLFVRIRAAHSHDASCGDPEQEEAEFERYCEEQRELNAIDAQICAEHGWPAEEGWPAIPPSVRLDGQCEWCNKDADELRPAHDWEELCGLAPRVYWVCRECLRKENESRDEATSPHHFWAINYVGTDEKKGVSP